MPAAIPRPCRSCLLVLLLLALSLPGCGGDPKPVPHHGLKVNAITSKPVGEPIEIGFEVPDGATYAADIKLHTEFWQRTAQGGRPSEKQAQASATLRVEQTFAVPGGDRPPSSTITLRYVDAQGPGMDRFLQRDPITGALDHERSGRGLPLSLRLDGGTQAEQIEALDRIGGLHWAGFAGSPAWLPEGPVREGEAWPVEKYLRPRGVDNARRQAQQTGLATPEPMFSGTVRVARIEDTPTGKRLTLEIDALIEVAGPFKKGSQAGHMSYANHVTGTAVIAAETGLPVAIDCKEVVRNDIRQGSARTEQRATATVRGTIQRKE